MNLKGDWLDARADATPERLALTFEGQSWSYRDLDFRVEEMTGRLARAGVRRGSHVAAMLPNAPEFVFLIHALARLRAVLVPLNLRLTPREHRELLRMADVVFLVRSEDTEKQAAEALEGLEITSVVVSESEFRRVDSRLSASQLGDKPVTEDGVNCIMFSSGTTGTPKGVMLTYGNHFASAMASAYHLGTLSGDRWVLCLPLYHVGGLAILWRACLYGNAVVLQKGFEECALLEEIRRHRATMISLVPTMLARLLETPDGADTLRGLRAILLGGAAAQQTLLDKCRAANLPLAPTYGLTEAASQVATALPDEWQERPGSVGRPLPFTRMRILAAEGSPAPAGEVGEIIVSGPTVMAGYYRMPEETAATLRDGWLHTGDLGFLDEDGALWVAERRLDLIISGGENIYPAEVERALLEHPRVAEACAVGLEDEQWGQRVGALVVLTEGTALPEDDLIAHCRARLAGYKTPRLVRIVADLPKTASGKLKRREAARWLQEEEECTGESVSPR